jgi:hypothetical protein
MGSRGLNDVAEYIRTLKRVTIFTQLLPFLYSLCYIAVLLAYLCGDIASSVSDIVCSLSCPHCNK